jgi:hypothetical protein
MKIRLFAGVAMLAVGLVAAGAGRAATPGSGAVGPGTTAATWQGKSYSASVVADPALCPPASLDSSNTVCDNFQLTADVDPSYWSIAAGGASVTISWADSANDFDLYVYDAAGNEVASSAQSGTTSEQAFIKNASGTYDVVVVPYTVTSSGYNGSASFVTQTPATYTSGGPVAYRGVRVAGANPTTAPATAATTYKGPSLVLQSTDVGREAAEPTLGVDKTGTAFYAASTFDGPGGETAHTLVLRSRDAGLTWQAATPEYAGVDAHPASLDPYVYLDTDTSRLFDIDTLLVGTTDLSFSDDQGNSWLTTLTVDPEATDHQTLIAAAPPAANPLVRPLVPTFPKIVYYCVNSVVDSGCNRSLDGGVTFTRTGGPAYLGFDAAAGGLCGGLHGHMASDSAGRLFVPKGHCGFPWLAISNDGGTTWSRVQVSKTIGEADIQSAVAVDAADNLYYTWWDDVHHLPYLSVSRDHGQTWSTPLEIAPPGVQEVNFPTITAGDTGHIALTFPGTMSGDRNDKARPWDSWVVVSTNALDASPTFVANIGNAVGDPIHRGDCLARCAGMFDFLDVVGSPSDGTVWASAVDTCTTKDSCNTVAAPGNDDAAGTSGVSSDMRGIAMKEIAGPRLYGTPIGCKKKHC